MVAKDVETAIQHSFKLVNLAHTNNVILASHHTERGKAMFPFQPLKKKTLTLHSWIQCPPAQTKPIPAS